MKLLATTVNGIGLSFLITGVALPLITLLYGGEAPKSPFAIWIGVWWLGQAGLFHVAARAVLEAIKA